MMGLSWGERAPTLGAMLFEIMRSIHLGVDIDPHVRCYYVEAPRTMGLSRGERAPTLGAMIYEIMRSIHLGVDIVIFAVAPLRGRFSLFVKTVLEVRNLWGEAQLRTLLRLATTIIDIVQTRERFFSSPLATLWHDSGRFDPLSYETGDACLDSPCVLSL